ncbi:hypothetical protein PQX77_005358 [Marasmius sp. AFHP31]|nr:hypothetical protein PQX77_005358 [Marasmius sp. AFHP31]
MAETLSARYNLRRRVTRGEGENQAQENPPRYEDATMPGGIQLGSPATGPRREQGELSGSPLSTDESDSDTIVPLHEQAETLPSGVSRSGEALSAPRVSGSDETENVAGPTVYISSNSSEGTTTPFFNRGRRASSAELNPEVREAIQRAERSMTAQQLDDLRMRQNKIRISESDPGSEEEESGIPYLAKGKFVDNNGEISDTELNREAQREAIENWRQIRDAGANENDYPGQGNNNDQQRSSTSEHVRGNKGIKPEAESDDEPRKRKRKSGHHGSKKTKGSKCRSRSRSKKRNDKKRTQKSKDTYPKGMGKYHEKKLKEAARGKSKTPNEYRRRHKENEILPSNQIPSNSRLAQTIKGLQKPEKKKKRLSKKKRDRKKRRELSSSSDSPYSSDSTPSDPSSDDSGSDLSPSESSGSGTSNSDSSSSDTESDSGDSDRSSGSTTSESSKPDTDETEGGLTGAMYPTESD